MYKLHPMALMAPLALVAPAFAQATAPDALVRSVSVEVISAIKADPALRSGDLAKVTALVDSKVMPHVNFEVMTRSAVGPQWRGASAEQRQRLQAEFKTLLLRVYSGALNELSDQSVEVTRTLPVAGSSQVVVQSEVRGRGEPIKLDYRMDKAGDTWKIIDVNVGGIWLVQSYRSQFATELNNGGIDNLIARLSERNRAPAGRS
jgi:phospholipid transport system substrate-binding protein